MRRDDPSSYHPTRDRLNSGVRLGYEALGIRPQETRKADSILALVSGRRVRTDPGAGVDLSLGARQTTPPVSANPGGVDRTTAAQPLTEQAG